jgi:hypothetical protein
MTIDCPKICDYNLLPISLTTAKAIFFYTLIQLPNDYPGGVKSLG